MLYFATLYSSVIAGIQWFWETHSKARNRSDIHLSTERWRLWWKGSPQARVRNAIAAILNHLNSARSKGRSSREIPTLKGLILFHTVVA